MISLHTGTNVPRLARSTNSSKVVSFMMATALNQGAARQSRAGVTTAASSMTPGEGRLAGPDLELQLGLRDQHRQAIERLAAGGARLPQQARVARVVDQVVHQAPVEDARRARASASTRGCMPAEVALTSTSQLPGCGGIDAAATPVSAAIASAASARRAHTVTRAPACDSAMAAPRAAPPAPRIVARRPDTSSRSASGASSPGTSVLNPRQVPSSRASVFTAPDASAQAHRARSAGADRP